MAPPSPLAILTGATNRLTKEHVMYQKECTEQQAQIEEHQKLFDQEGNTKDENSEYLLNQKKESLLQTQRVFPGLENKIQENVMKLQQEIAHPEGKDEAELKKAAEAVETALKQLSAR